MNRLDAKLRALEAAFKPPPDRWAELRRTWFPVPLTLEILNDREGYTARCRAEWVAAGNVINDDAQPEPQWVEGLSEDYIAEQQRRLLADGQAEVDRAIAREAERKAAERAAEAPPTPQRKLKPPPPFVHVATVFDTPSRI